MIPLEAVGASGDTRLLDLDRPVATTVTGVERARAVTDGSVLPAYEPV